MSESVVYNSVDKGNSVPAYLQMSLPVVSFYLHHKSFSSPLTWAIKVTF